MTEYEIEITKDGIKLEAKGFHGKTCLQELAEIERQLKVLGIDTELVSQDLKREAMFASGVSETARREVRR
jgi:hypothetical protein